ncbi:PaaI family thioesterase [Sinorhizobium meliloti]|uniref:PaaI family thioesterase n=1 Tax=Rhizobium meliloti TaxID=382 RepID=UPI0035ABAD2F
MPSAIERLNAIRNGVGAAPPIYKLLDISVVEAREGEVSLQFRPHEGPRNPIGLVAGGAIATLLDTALAWACDTCVPSDQVSTTIELKVNFLRPVSVSGGTVVATARVIHPGNRILVATADLRQMGIDGAQALNCAVATATCMIIPATG